MPLSRSMKVEQPVILAFALFATLVGAADFWLTFVGPAWIKEPTIAYTGWSPSTPYLFGIYWAFHLLATHDRRRWMRLGLVAPLVVGVVSGYTSYRMRGEDFGNPYLRVSPWQPVWTMVVPSAWAVLLLLLPNSREPSADLDLLEGAKDVGIWSPLAE